MSIFLLCVAEALAIYLSGVPKGDNDLSRSTRIVAFDKLDKVAIAKRETSTSVGIATYDLASGEELFRYSSFGIALSFEAAPKDGYLLLGGAGDPILFDMKEKTRWRPSIDAVVGDARFRFDGNSFLANNGVALFECNMSNRSVKSFSPFRSVTPILMIDSARDADSIMMLAEELGASKQTIWSWDLRSPPNKLNKVSHVNAIALSSDAKLYAVSDVKQGKPFVAVADLASGTAVFEIEMARHETFLQFSHDAKWLVCSSIAGGPVRVYSLVSKELAKEFDDVAAYPSFFSAAAKLVLFRPGTSTVVTYDMATGMQEDFALKPEQ